jgi:hemoglobin-like flavoprotein
MQFANGKLFKFMMTENTMTEKEQLTEEQMEAVQNSWKQVEGSIELAIDFYNRLFYLYPALRPLFKEDIRTQARKFTAHLSYLIKHVRNWDAINTDVQELGKRHVTYQVKPLHYEHVGEALFYALRFHLKTKWDAPVEEAWQKFYRIVADKMMGSPHHK